MYGRIYDVCHRGDDKTAAEASAVAMRAAEDEARNSPGSTKRSSPCVVSMHILKSMQAGQIQTDETKQAKTDKFFSFLC